MPLNSGIQVREVTNARRKIRHPRHPFQVRHRPWQITPFFIAPVLPGETMKSLLMQAQVVSDPVKSKLVGWWYETYFFYVKHRDLDGRDTFTTMHLDTSTSLGAFNQAALTEYYHSGAGISWVKECLKRVTEYYFRYEDEAWDDFTIGNLPIVSRSMTKDMWDSAINDTDRAVGADVNVDLDANSTITVSEIDKARAQWEFLQTQGLAHASFEDYLATFGVRPDQRDLHRPELVRFLHQWAYPTNHIDPADGSPTSALVWKLSERADKDRYIKEPGFLFGVCVARPKVYLAGQKATATDLMTDAYTWLPNVVRGDTQMSYKKLAAFSADIFGGNGTSTGNADGVWFDLRDLFEYGEQFVNFALTETDAGLVALPTAALEKWYASATDADALFASASPANQIRADGLVSLSIASTVADTSPSV